jgi:hypothetical protein
LSWGGGELDACDISDSPWVSVSRRWIGAIFGDVRLFCPANLPRCRGLTNRKSGDFQAALD